MLMAIQGINGARQIYVRALNDGVGNYLVGRAAVRAIAYWRQEQDNRRLRPDVSVALLLQFDDPGNAGGY